MKLALGTAQFGMNYGVANDRGQATGSEIRAILEHARANGVDTLDTAIAYGDSEQQLGTVGVDDWHVVTKLPAIPDFCESISDWITESVKNSLARLNISKLYGLLLHKPIQLLGPDGIPIYESLLQCKYLSLTKKIGVSIYDPAELDKFSGRFDFDLVQAPFNLLDRRLIDSGWLDRMVDSGTELHVRSAFLQGLLLMGSSRPEKFSRWDRVWGAYDRWLKEAGISPLQACLRYVTSFAGISRVVIGVDCKGQLAEILTAAEGPLPPLPSELATADAELINPSCWPTLL